MFTVTPAAAQEILAAAQRSDAAGMALRVAARQVADGSIEFGMGFDDEREDDEPAQFDGLKVLVGAPSKPLLADTVLDYVEVESGRFDFIFAPATPSAPHGCAGSTAPARPSSSCGGGRCGSGACGG